MKNRLLSRMTGLGMTVFMLTGMLNICLLGNVFGADLEQQDEKVKMISTAVWTDEEKYRAELRVEITGLKAWVAAYKNGKNENKEMISDEVSETPDFDSGENVSGKNTDEKAEENEEEKEINKKPELEDPGTGESGRKEPGLEDPGTGEYGTKEPGTEEPGKGESEIEEPGAEKPSEEKTDAEKSETEKTEGQEPESAAKSSDLSVNIPEMRVTANPSRSEKHSVTAITVSDDVRETPDITEENNREIVLEAWISKYFSVPEEELPKGCSSRILMVPGEEDEPEANTEVVRIFTDEEMERDSCSATIPLNLKEEYRYCESPRRLAVPASEEGVMLSMKEHDQRIMILTNESDIVLDTPETPADFTLSVKTDSENPKPGQTLSYLIDITNTGRQPLPLMALESSVSPSELSCTWSADASLETDVTGKRAILSDLKTGETRRITCRIKLPEDQSEPVINRITASAQKASDPGMTIVRDITLKTSVTPLKVDFSVSKSADRTKAGPGDTITYQICIRNTGERTLHSVLSTERFQTENIRARFVEKEGVLLSTDKTQALITEIPPGEVFSLDAVVSLPEELKSGELLNQVLVKTRETGDKIVQSTAAIQIVNISPTPSLEGDSSEEQKNRNETDTGNDAFTPSDSPKTSDDTNPAFWLIMLGTAFFASAGAWGYHQFRKKQ